MNRHSKASSHSLSRVGAQPRPFLILLPLILLGLAYLPVMPGSAQTASSDPSALTPLVVRYVTTNAIAARNADVPDRLLSNPFVKYQADGAGQLVADFTYYSTNSAAPPTLPVIAVDATGATARNGPHEVRFQGNLKDDDAITIVLPDAQVLQGRAVAISVSDAKGRRVWLGEVKDCQGQLLEKTGNQVLYPDAFDGIRASVIYTYDLNSFEQDIILHEKPVLPSEIDETTARVEVWSAFAVAPEPQKVVQNVVLRNADALAGRGRQIVAKDELLDFGSMQIVAGKAFRHALADGTERVAIGSVVKRWLRDEKSAYLLESADYASLKTEMDALHARRF